MSDPCGDRNAMYLAYKYQYHGCDIEFIVLQNVTTGWTWIKDVQDLSVLFLTATCESTVISK